MELFIFKIISYTDYCSNANSRNEKPETRYFDGHCCRNVRRVQCLIQFEAITSYSYVSRQQVKAVTFRRTDTDENAVSRRQSRSWRNRTVSVSGGVGCNPDNSSATLSIRNPSGQARCPAKMTPGRDVPYVERRIGGQSVVAKEGRKVIVLDPKDLLDRRWWSWRVPSRRCRETTTSSNSLWKSGEDIFRDFFTAVRCIDDSDLSWRKVID